VIGKGDEMDLLRRRMQENHLCRGDVDTARQRKVWRRKAKRRLKQELKQEVNDETASC